jgi:hypothetical protein
MKGSKIVDVLVIKPAKDRWRRLLWGKMGAAAGKVY